MPEATPAPAAGDEPSLVARAQRDPAAFTALYDRYVGRVYGYHLSRVGAPADAQDLTAQTFLTALEALPRYRERGAFAAWLFQIARSKAMDFFRRRRPQVSLDLIEAMPAPAEAPLGELEPLRALMRALPADERELLHLRYAADLKFGEIAAVTGQSEAAVKKAVYRLLARLHAQLEPQHE
ncbi:MAG: sigma-70 family RNA polymerase sigma factor [Anaerolineales bacterium]|nr:sigma-70 family RNA polymerase sigma factor [Anaerolineales bacterium]